MSLIMITEAEFSDESDDDFDGYLDEDEFEEGELNQDDGEGTSEPEGTGSEGGLPPSFACPPPLPSLPTLSHLPPLLPVFLPPSLSPTGDLGGCGPVGHSARYLQFHLGLLSSNHRLCREADP